MTNVPWNVHASVVAAVVPTPRDLMEARQVVIGNLSDNDLHPIAELRDAFLTHLNLPTTAPSRREDAIVLNRDDAGGYPEVDRDHPQLRRARALRAVDRTLYELHADGDIEPVPMSTYKKLPTGGIALTLTHRSGSTQTSVSYDVDNPTWAPDPTGVAWRLRPYVIHPRVDVGRATLVEGLHDILGARGVQVLGEAAACLRIGRYLPAVDLLAAASESAWFTLGAACGDTDSKLAQLVEQGERAAEVIERTDTVLAQRKAIDHATRRMLRAQAERLRDLRNYGLHPVGAVNDDHEDAFTEAGAVALFMGARRYFTALDTARQKLVADLDLS